MGHPTTIWLRSCLAVLTALAIIAASWLRADDGEPSAEALLRAVSPRRHVIVAEENRELSAPLRADHANIRAAFADAVDERDQESATGLALGLRPLWVAGNLRQESGEVTERLLDCFSIPGEQELALLKALDGKRTVRGAIESLIGGTDDRVLLKKLRLLSHANLQKPN